MPPSIQAPAINLQPLPLTSSAFAPFGSAITTPLDPSISAFHPSLLSKSPPPPSHATPVAANQSSALKYSPITPCQNLYSSAPSKCQPEPRVSLFASFPRTLRRSAEGTPSLFDITILERHPYTTQTFIPFGLDAADTETNFLVIVAPSLPGSVASVDGPHTVTRPPNLEHVQAFICKGNQAVTYGPGTWHAPMVVLGKKRVDFVVVQFLNGVADEDCQEVEFGEGLVVDLGWIEGRSGHATKSRL